MSQINNTTNAAREAGQNNQPLTLREKLIAHIGSDVTIENVAHSIGVEQDGKIDFCLNGKLEGPDDDDGTFYVRVKECYNGCSGIRFGVVNLDREFPIEKQPSGRIVITLK